MMREFRLILIVLMTVGLSACGVMLPGTMDGLDDGSSYSFEIETSRGTGKMVATNLATGEVFTGSYSGRFTNGGQIDGIKFSSSGVDSFTGFIRPTHATAEGMLIGDQGTYILIYFNITPGLRPTGTGTGIDAGGNKYWVQF